MNISILHVEDDEVVRMAVKRKVKAEGLSYDIETVDTIAGAIKLLAGNRYDIVLLDYMLPDGTGLDLLPVLKGLPAIFMTGSGDASVAVKAMKGGAHDYLIKDEVGTHLSLLPATIEKVMRAYYLEQEHKKDEEQIRILNEELSKMYEAARESSLHDPLTGLANRRLMNIDLERSIALASRSGGHLSVLMMDIDYFKKYNDTHGHQAGDRLLSEIGKVVSEEVRGGDLIARYGGEEFFVLLPDTNLNGACSAAEKIRKAVAESLGVTISIGAASYNREQKMEELIGKADAALYQAKQKGRNKVEAEL